MDQQTLTLIPLAMVQPTRGGVYTPSRIQPLVEISPEDFVKWYAEHPRGIWVSLAPDGVSNPVRLTAYGFGLDCWWLVSNG